MLILFPNLIGEASKETSFPPAMDEAVASCQGLICESERAGRRFLSRFVENANKIPVALLSEEPSFLLEPIIKGETWGLVSDAGMPCCADPGASVVLLARRKRIAVETFPGPSSVMMALILSGLPGQRFAFHGYFDRERISHIQQMEKTARKENSTQIAMEAPYRNDHALKELVETLSPQTFLCLACDLTSPDQLVITKKVSEWRNEALPDIRKRPALYLISS